MRYHVLDQDSLPIVRYVDAVFADKTDLSPQLGRLIDLVETGENKSILPLKLYKYRVTRSELCAEVIPFSDILDYAFAFGKQLVQKLNRSMTVLLMNDRYFLSGIIGKSSC